jgi:hypothetical protein
LSFAVYSFALFYVTFTFFYFLFSSLSLHAEEVEEEAAAAAATSPQMLISPNNVGVRLPSLPPESAKIQRIQFRAAPLGKRKLFIYY